MKRFLYHVLFLFAFTVSFSQEGGYSTHKLKCFYNNNKLNVKNVSMYIVVNNDTIHADKKGKFYNFPFFEGKFKMILKLDNFTFKAFDLDASQMNTDSDLVFGIITDVSKLKPVTATNKVYIADKNRNHFLVGKEGYVIAIKKPECVEEMYFLLFEMKKNEVDNSYGQCVFGAQQIVRTKGICNFSE